MNPMTKSHPSAKIPSLAVRGILIDHVKADMDTHYVCLPIPTLKAARERMRFEGTNKAKQVEIIAAESYHATYCPHVEDDWADLRRRKDVGSKNVIESYRKQARAVLALIQGSTK